MVSRSGSRTGSSGELPPQPAEKLNVPPTAGDGGRGNPLRENPLLLPFPQSERVPSGESPDPDNSFATHLFPARFELRLHQGHHIRRSFQHSCQRGQDQGQGDKGNIHRRNISHSPGSPPASYDENWFAPLQPPADPTQLPGQLPIAHIDSVHLGRPILRSTIG